LQYFGLEFAAQCLAGNELNPLSAPIDSSRCSMACAGNSSQTCGGPNAISLYNNTQWIKPYNPNPVNVPNQQGAQYSYVGCYTEGNGARALGSTANSGSAAMPQSDSLTVETCAGYCFSQGFAWMGVENGNLCFCNSAGIINSATLAPNGDSDCSVTCAGDPTENCGSRDYINIYQSSGSGRFAGSTTKRTKRTKTSKRGRRVKM
jgi:hypothetical protein